MGFKKTTFLSGMLLALFFAVSCDENGTIQLPVINIDTKTVTIPAEGGQVTVSADIPLAWSVAPGAAWLNVDPSSGAAGAVTLVFSAEANETGEAREANSVISATGLSPVTITVSQPAMETPQPPTPSIELSAESMSVQAEGGQMSLTITSNVAWKAQVDVDWITLTQNSGEQGTSTIVVTAAENKQAEPRTSTVIISGDSVRKTVTVSQAAGKADPDDIGVGGGVNDWGEGGSIGFEQ